MRRLLALRDLVHDAIEKTTDLVQDTHEAAARKPIAVLSAIEPIGSVARGVDDGRKRIAGLVFDSVRATNRAVQQISDLSVSLVESVLATPALTQPVTSLLDELASRAALQSATERAESALNAVMGDFLEARDNGLAIPMTLRSAGRELTLDPDSLREALPNATGKLCLFVHGLGCSDSIWFRSGADAHPYSFGTELTRNLGYTPLWVRYNTGRHISENGRDLARLLGALHAAYPKEIEQIALVGHSMGGLVSRSAAHYASVSAEAWARKLSHVLCIASPHFGAPLERAGNVLASVLRFFDTAGTQVPAKLINARSAGVKDLRFGYILDEDWAGRDPDALLTDTSQRAPFVDGVTYGYVAAHFHPTPDGPLSELLGDLLVQLPSACGSHRDQTRHLPFHIGHVVPGVHHLGLTTHPAVCAQLERFLTECKPVP